MFTQEKLNEIGFVPSLGCSEDLYKQLPEELKEQFELDNSFSFKRYKFNPVRRNKMFTSVEIKFDDTRDSVCSVISEEISKLSKKKQVRLGELVNTKAVKLTDKGFHATVSVDDNFVVELINKVIHHIPVEKFEPATLKADVVEV